MKKCQTIKQAIIEKFGIPEENFGNYSSDLHVLPTEEVSLSDIRDFVMEKFNWCQCPMFFANVEGHDWYGQQFLEIPFGYSEYFTKD